MHKSLAFDSRKLIIYQNTVTMIFMTKKKREVYFCDSQPGKILVGMEN